MNLAIKYFSTENNFEPGRKKSVTENQTMTSSDELASLCVFCIHKHHYHPGITVDYLIF